MVLLLVSRGLGYHRFGGSLLPCREVGRLQQAELWEEVRSLREGVVGIPASPLLLTIFQPPWGASLLHHGFPAAMLCLTAGPTEWGQVPMGWRLQNHEPKHQNKYYLLVICWLEAFSIASGRLPAHWLHDLYPLNSLYFDSCRLTFILKQVSSFHIPSADLRLHSILQVEWMGTKICGDWEEIFLWLKSFSDCLPARVNFPFILWVKLVKKFINLNILLNVADIWGDYKIDRSLMS